MSEKVIPITADELSGLIKASCEDGNGAVQTTFPGGDLIVCDENRWAMELIALWRGLFFPLDD